MMLPPVGGPVPVVRKSPVPTWNFAVLMLPRRAALDSRLHRGLAGLEAVVAPAFVDPGL